ncbi:MAG: transcriptional regulator [Candidatus Margulisiibacteriota bacterium]|nr:MAG: transcriptional regulator [Candidatus Margulisiibacteriota bacterium]
MIKNDREQKKLTQEQVAAGAGVGWRHYQRIEAGEVNPTLCTFLNIANIVSSSPQEMLSQLLQEVDNNI